MTLTDFISNLQRLERDGYGNTHVYYRHGASSDCGELSSAHTSTYVDEYGPFDLEEGEVYISIYAGA